MDRAVNDPAKQHCIGQKVSGDATCHEVSPVRGVLSKQYRILASDSKNFCCESTSPSVWKKEKDALGHFEKAQDDAFGCSIGSFSYTFSKEKEPFLVMRRLNEAHHVVSTHTLSKQTY